MIKKYKDKKETGGVGGVPPHRNFNFKRAFFDSVKPLSLEEEKERALGSEPVF